MQIGDYKKLGDKFRNQPDLLCKKTSDCLKRLRDDGNVAYGDVRIAYNIHSFILLIALVFFNLISPLRSSKR